MKTRAIEQTTLKPIAKPGTPCLLTHEKTRGNSPSIDIWCSDRAQPMMAFSTERQSAMISIHAMRSSSRLAELPNSLLANVTNIWFASTKPPTSVT